MRTLLLVTGLSLTLAGCAGTTPTPQEIDDPGLTDADHVGTYEVQTAAKEMCRKISEYREWPSYVKLSADGNKPQVRITKITNRTSVRFDVRYLKNELENVMNEQGVVWLVAESGGADLSDLHEERDSHSTSSSDEEARGEEQASGLILFGEIEASSGLESSSQHDYVFYLKLYDTRKSQATIITRKGFRKVKERNAFGG